MGIEHTERSRDCRLRKQAAGRVHAADQADDLRGSGSDSLRYRTSFSIGDWHKRFSATMPVPFLARQQIEPRWRLQNGDRHRAFDSGC